MDDRTARLIDGLDSVGVALLVELSDKDATERDLMAAVGAPSQPTANRHLARLRRLRLIAREPGRAHAPGRLWTLVHPDETAALLAALFSLSEAVDARDRDRRRQAQRRLKQARAKRLGIRRIK
jgi:DNA-binding HxlR family transcriptional regulator